MSSNTFVEGPITSFALVTALRKVPRSTPVELVVDEKHRTAEVIEAESGLAEVSITENRKIVKSLSTVFSGC
jgi:hypothetical protein